MAPEKRWECNAFGETSPVFSRTHLWVSCIYTGGGGDADMGAVKLIKLTPLEGVYQESQGFFYWNWTQPYSDNLPSHELATKCNCILLFWVSRNRNEVQGINFPMFVFKLLKVHNLILFPMCWANPNYNSLASFFLKLDVYWSILLLIQFTPEPVHMVIMQANHDGLSCWKTQLACCFIIPKPLSPWYTIPETAILSQAAHSAKVYLKCFKLKFLLLYAIIKWYGIITWCEFTDSLCILAASNLFETHGLWSNSPWGIKPFSGLDCFSWWELVLLSTAPYKNMPSTYWGKSPPLSLTCRFTMDFLCAGYCFSWWNIPSCASSPAVLCAAAQTQVYHFSGKWLTSYPWYI